MPYYPYLIVGGGLAAASAIRGIRDVDPNAEIGLVSAEPDPPYNRPPLSKGLWKGQPLKGIWRKVERPGVTLHLGRRILSLDPQAKQATDDAGVVYSFGKCLLATGGSPRRLAFGGDGIIYYRTLADYHRLHALADQADTFAVVGGGFIGSEVAAALAMNGKRVTLVFPEAGLGARVFPPDLAGHLVGYYRERGVEVLPLAAVVGVEPQGERFALEVQAAEAEREHLVAGVVAGVGLSPSVEVARAAGLAVENGIVVDEQLRAGHPDVYAAGDVASFPSPVLGKRIRVEHEDNASTMGRLAGRNMAGEAFAYHHLPFFYSDLFDLGYEAVGTLDSRLQTVVDWQEPYAAGVVYYLDAGRVRGVLLWNVWEQVEAARRLIAEPGPFRPDDLRGRLPEAR